VDTCFAAAARAPDCGRADRPSVVAAELARLGRRVRLRAVLYFGRAHAPDPRVTRAGGSRHGAVAGLNRAGLGRRRLASTLLGGGALWSVGALAVALRSAE